MHETGIRISQVVAEIYTSSDLIISGQDSIVFILKFIFNSPFHNCVSDPSVVLCDESNNERYIPKHVVLYKADIIVSLFNHFNMIVDAMPESAFHHVYRPVLHLHRVSSRRVLSMQCVSLGQVCCGENHDITPHLQVSDRRYAGLEGGFL